MNNLQKFSKDLTAKDQVALKKYLGVVGRPYPMRDSIEVEDKDGNRNTLQTLGVIESDSNPLTVYSDRPYAEVVGISMREMFSPGMLPLFKKAINACRPDNKSKVIYWKGDAGSGKTYGAEVIARMMSPLKPIKVDCGKKDLNSLLFETVLDIGSSRSFYAAIDEKLAKGTLSPVSLAKLEHTAGKKAFHRENGRVWIDWNQIGIKDNSGHRAPSDVAEMLDVVRQIADVENVAGGNALGMATQKGPLIRAWEEGRHIILDEFNRCKPGTTGSLHTVLQFLAGETDFCTVENTLKDKGDDVGQIYSFRREDQRAGFRTWLTANNKEDGEDVEDLPQSVNSRIIPQYIPKATLEDEQHKWGQFLTGLPVSTLYRIGQKQWDEDPKAFGEMLVQWRTMGLSEKEIKNIPPEHIDGLLDWQKTLEATELLAKFMQGWAEITNIDSPLYRKGSLAELMQELDESYKKEVSIDNRKTLAFINMAKEVTPTSISSADSEGFHVGSWDQMPVLPESRPEPSGYHRGTRLVSIILDHVRMTTLDIGKTKIYDQLMRLAEKCRLIEGKLEEGQVSQSRSVAELLNDNPYESDKLDTQAKVVRDLMSQHLRRLNPDITAPDDDLINLSLLGNALAGLRDGVETEDEGDNPGAAMPLFNEDAETQFAVPLRTVRAIDRADIAVLGANATPPTVNELASRDSVLAALAAPVVRTAALGALWTGALTRNADTMRLFTNPDKTVPDDQSLAVADGVAESGLSLTTVLTSGAAADGKLKEQPLHIIWNRNTDRLLVVGEGKIAPDLKAAFNATRGVYVDRLEKNAAIRVRNALNMLITKDKSKNQDILKTAFRSRAALPSAQEEEKLDLKSLLVRPDVKAFLPVYITNQPELPFYGQ